MKTTKKRSVSDILLYLLIPLAAYLLIYAANFVVQNVAYAIIYMHLSKNHGAQVPHEDVMNVISGNTSLLYVIAGVIFIAIILLLNKKTKLFNFTGIVKRKLPKNGVINIIALGLFMGILFNIMLNVMEPIIPKAWLEGNQESVGVFLKENFLITLCAVSIFAPIVEELLFRGFLYNCMKKITGKIWISSIVTSVLFGVYHGNILQAIYTGLFSFVMIWVYEQSDSLVSSMIFHGALNASSFFAAIIMHNNMEIAAMIICPIISVFLMIIFSKKCKNNRIVQNEKLQSEKSGGNY